MAFPSKRTMYRGVESASRIGLRLGSIGGASRFVIRARRVVNKGFTPHCSGRYNICMMTSTACTRPHSIAIMKESRMLFAKKGGTMSALALAIANQDGDNLEIVREDGTYHFYRVKYRAMGGNVMIDMTLNNSF